MRTADDPEYRYDVDHFNTKRGYPQSKAEVDAASDKVVDDFMGQCPIEPADFENCLACYAYKVAQDREAQAKPKDPLREVLRDTLDSLLVDAHGVPDTERDAWADRLAHMARAALRKEGRKV